MPPPPPHPHPNCCLVVENPTCSGIRGSRWSKRLRSCLIASTPPRPPPPPLTIYSAAVETKGFAPVSVDAEVDGEIVQEDGTPMPAVAAEPKAKVRQAQKPKAKTAAEPSKAQASSSKKVGIPLAGIYIEPRSIHSFFCCVVSCCVLFLLGGGRGWGWGWGIWFVIGIFGVLGVGVTWFGLLAFFISLFIWSGSVCFACLVLFGFGFGFVLVWFWFGLFSFECGLVWFGFASFRFAVT